MDPDKLARALQGMGHAALSDLNEAVEEAVGYRPPVVKVVDGFRNRIGNPPSLFEESSNPPMVSTVILEDIGPNRLAVMRMMRKLGGLSLTETKALFETTPVALSLGDLWHEDVSRIQRSLEGLGAVVRITSQ